jgi:TonB-linked SusC/RagA family outer membrane protein
MKLIVCLIKICLFLVLVTCQIKLYAREPVKKGTPNSCTAFVVNGKIVDGKGNGLAGASIIQKERSNGTTSAVDGSFSITIQEGSAVLVISHIGFQSKEVLVKAGTTNIIVELKPGIGLMEDVIVIGYGTQKKQLSTSAVATVKSEQLTTVPAANISNSMAGRATGIMTRATGGRPGADNATMYVRGVATIGTTVNGVTYNTTPLIVVDGVIRNNINEVDPNNIESVSVLKDAAAVAPYGLGGANGVILITTKRGISGAPTLSFGGYYGDQQPTYLPKMLSAVDYMKLKLEAYLTENPGGTNPTYSQPYIDSYVQNHAKDPDLYPISDALNDVVIKHSPIYQSNFQVRGGSQNVKYYAGLGYFKQNGMFNKSGYERYNYNVNIDINITPTTLASFSINGAVQKTSDVDGGTSQLFRGVYKFIPVAPLKFTNGLWGESSGNAPLGVTHSNGYFRQYTNNILSTITLEQKLPFIKGLSVKGAFSYDPYNYVQKQWHVPFIYWTQNTSTTPYTYTPAYSTQESSATSYTWLNEQYWQNNTITWQGYLNYHYVFGKHDITGLAVAELRSNKEFDFRSRVNNFAVNIDELSLGSSNRNDFDLGGGSGTGSQVGYVYRASYAYDRRFLFEASGRYDGHYYFAPGKRWVYLPAFSLGWILSNENFFKPVTFVDYLKVRGSWGKSGNLTSTGFQYLNTYPLRGNAYSFGDGSLVQGSYVQIENNPNITWEISKKTDVAMEANLWKGLLRLEADYFYERRTGMLLSPNVIVPQEYGLQLAQQNAGIMDNHGIELSIGTTKKFNNGLQVSLDGNFTYAKNKVIQMYETAVTRNDPRRSRTGRPYNTVFGYHALGLFTTADDKNGDGFISAADGYNVTQFGTIRPGDIKYADISGPNGVPDGKIDSYDETVIARPDVPAIIYGINVNASWKGFDLSMLFQGSGMSSFNVYGFMTVAGFNNNSNSSYEYYNNRWTPDHQDSKYPRAYSAPTNNNGQSSDFWYVSSAYLRLRTVSLGYTIPAKISAKASLKNFRIYVTGQNMLTFGKLKFTDPETTGEQGYPLQKVLLVGFNTSF